MKENQFYPVSVWVRHCSVLLTIPESISPSFSLWVTTKSHRRSSRVDLRYSELYSVADMAMTIEGKKKNHLSHRIESDSIWFKTLFVVFSLGFESWFTQIVSWLFRGFMILWARVLNCFRLTQFVLLIWFFIFFIFSYIFWNAQIWCFLLQCKFKTPKAILLLHSCQVVFSWSL